MSAPRVGLIGARRQRQGLGPFVARDLRAAGAAVPCFLGTSRETLEAAQSALRAQAGGEARGYLRLDEMLERERLDALAILSPAETHDEYLAAAAEAGLHALCEKPLIWGAEDLLGRARARVQAFRSRGLLLAENCQWPYTLPAFRRLFPDLSDQPPKTLRMRLSPVSSGLEQIGDCLPHPLSLLQVLAPAAQPELRSPRFSPLGADSTGLELSFQYWAGGARVDVSLELRPDPGVPRAASLEIDGYRAERRIRLPAYEIEFEHGSRSVSVPDPLTARIRAFMDDLEAVCGGNPPPDPLALVQRMQMLDTLVRAYRREAGNPGG